MRLFILVFILPVMLFAFTPGGNGKLCFPKADTYQITFPIKGFIFSSNVNCMDDQALRLYSPSNSDSFRLDFVSVKECQIGMNAIKVSMSTGHLTTFVLSKTEGTVQDFFQH